MVTLTKAVFEKLVAHLIYIEESADRVADFYFPDSEQDQEDLKRFFAEYIKKIENEMENVSVVSSFAKAECINTLNTFPFVIIDSEVELENVTERSAHVYKLIHPDSQDAAKNGITYLSPLGKALLLKNAGSEINIGDSGTAPQILKIKTIRLLA